MRKFLIIMVMVMAAGSARAETIKASVNGLVCSFCATGIEKTFRALPAVEGVKVDLEAALVTIDTKAGQSLDDAEVRKRLEDSGYTVTKIERGKP
jgi:mercuric ion binding protein